MALLRRMKQSDIKNLSNQFLRSYFQIHSPCRAKNSCNNFFVLNYRSLPFKKCQFEPPSNARFFAAPVQVKPKKEENSTGPRLNEKITADVVRLVTEEGHWVVPKQEALKRAKSLKLDLVEVQQHAMPPVCKIMDYYREKYQQELKEKDRSRNKSETTLRKGACKEIRFSGNITQKDLQIKVDTVKRLMERGYRVKCQAKGNKNKDGEGEDSVTLLSRICAQIEDISIVESDTRVEDKDQAHIIVRHIKYGPTKKGSVKKGSTVNKLVSSSAQNDDDIVSEEKTDEDFEKERSGWDLDNPNDDFENIFELDCPDVAKNIRNEKQSSSSSGVSSHYPGPSPGDGSATSSISIAGTENRYMKDPRNSSRQRSALDASGGERNNSHSGSQFLGSRSRQQMDLNPSPMPRRTEYSENQPFTFRNKNGPEQAPFGVSNSSSPPSYGIFSKVGNASGEQNLPAETNRYKQRNPSGTGTRGHTGKGPGSTASPRF